MSSVYGSGVLNQMGIIPNPVGTLEEVRRAGLDPNQVASCAPSADSPNRIQGVRGCPVYDECIFGQKRYNGGKWSKGVDGPHYVGYRLQTHEGDIKEDDCTCFTFIKTLKRRMLVGLAERSEGRRGELIRITAQEGEMIRTRQQVRVDPKDRGPNPEWKWDMALRPVHTFPRPDKNPQLTYEQQLLAAERDAQKREDDYIEAFTPGPLEYAEAPNEPTEPTEEDYQAILNMPAPTGQLATAAPDKPKKPPKPAKANE